METKTILTDRQEILAYLFAGKAKFTLVSQNTGKRFTYQIRKAKETLYFVDVLTGSDNENDFSFIGSAWNDKSFGFKFSEKSDMSSESVSVLAISWFFTHLRNKTVPDSVEFWTSGVCARCGHDLTDPASVARGLGPICATKAA